MATYEIAGFVEYGLDSGTTYDFIAPTAGGLTLDDGEIDSTFEVGEPTTGAGNNFAGTISIPLSGGGSRILPVIESTNANELVVVIPAGTSLSDYSFPSQIDSSTFDTSDFTVCFAAGTMIATAEGEQAVETLRIGDTVKTEAGATVAVKWIGRQSVLTPFSPQGSAMVRIRAGALGHDLPHRDLTVTADHGMVIDGYVINASALINGDTINLVPSSELAQAFTVYHIETENHYVIFANGAPSETFVDVVTRSHFDNHDEYLALYGADRIIPEMPLARISSSRLLPHAVRVRLNAACAHPDWKRALA